MSDGTFPTGQRRNLALLEDALRGVHLSDAERLALVALAEGETGHGLPDRCGNGPGPQRSLGHA